MAVGTEPKLLAPSLCFKNLILNHFDPTRQNSLRLVEYVYIDLNQVSLRQFAAQPLVRSIHERERIAADKHANKSGVVTYTIDFCQRHHGTDAKKGK
jgi:hypothetical protein